MFARFLLRKLDNGYRAEIMGVEESVNRLSIMDNINRLGAGIFNRNFHAYGVGTEFEAVVDIKEESGRRYVMATTPRTLISFVPVNVDKPNTQEKSVSTPKAKVNLDGYYISHEVRLTFSTAVQMLKRNPKRPVKILIVGPSGYGKTTIPRLAAEVLGMEFMRMNCATVRDPEEWFGYREARKGSTVFIPSEFGKRIQAGNSVIVLDEFNRIEPWLHNTLFPLLDEDGRTTVHDEEFVVGENTLAVATINTGYKFTGTFELDEALVNRFDFVLEVGEMPHEHEVEVLTTRTGIDKNMASTMVKLSKSLRQIGAVCSIRTTLLMANMIVSDMNMREAFESAVIRRIPQDNNGSTMRKQALDMVAAQLGHLETRKLPHDIFATAKKKAGKVPEVKVVATITLASSMAAANIGFIGLMNFIRGLPTLNGTLSMSRCRILAEAVREGQTITIELTETINSKNAIETLLSLGVTCSFVEMGE